MKAANPYLFLDNCKENLEYYHQIFGGEVQAIQLADGIKGFEGNEGKYLHAELHLGASIIHFSDIFAPVTKGDNIRVALEFESEAEIRRVYAELIKDGQAPHPLQDTFWGALHANVIDKNGIGWLLNYQK